MPRHSGGRGRVPGDPLTRRSVALKTMFRPSEYDDLEAIAEGWKVPVATVCWALVADRLATFRGTHADLAEVGVAVVAARRMHLGKATIALEPDDQAEAIG